LNVQPSQTVFACIETAPRANHTAPLRQAILRFIVSDG